MSIYTERNHWQQEWSERKWVEHNKKKFAREVQDLKISGKNLKWDERKDILRDAEDDAYYALAKKRRPTTQSDEELDKLVAELTGL